MFPHLYRYITQPTRLLRLYDVISIRQEWVLVLVLLGLSNAASGYPVSVFQFVGTSLFYSGVLAIILIVECLFWDFLAQVFFKREGQSFLLFKWIVLTTLPSLLSVPASLLVSGGMVFVFLGIALHVASLGLVFVLQVLTLKTVYELSTKESVLVFFLPGILGFGALISAVILGVISFGG